MEDDMDKKSQQPGQHSEQAGRDNQPGQGTQSRQGQSGQQDQKGGLFGDEEDDQNRDRQRRAS